MTTEQEIPYALSELNVILMHTEKEIVSKIPKKFMEFIYNNKDSNHSFQFEEGVPLINQKITDTTRMFIGFIYRNYICNDEERREYDKVLKANEEREEKEKREKFDTNKIFQERIEQKNIELENMRNSEEEQAQDVSLIQYNELPWYKKIFRFIRNLFKKE